MVTNGDVKTNKKVKPAPHPLASLRGVYSRVARELGVDRSYVSRVASGERQSAEVQEALSRELIRLGKLAASAQAKNTPSSNSKRVTNNKKR